MKKFNQGRDRGFGRDSGSSRDFGRNDRRGGFDGRSGGGPAMHKAICSKCGIECEVPFKPTGGKPVFCSNCFENKNRSESRFDDRRSSRPRFDDNKFSGNKFNESKKPVSDAKLDEVISRLDKIIRLLTPVIDLRENNNKSEKLPVIEKKSKDIIKKEDKKLKTKTKTKTGDKDVKKNTKKVAKTSVKKNNKKK